MDGRGSGRRCRVLARTNHSSTGVARRTRGIGFSVNGFGTFVLASFIIRQCYLRAHIMNNIKIFVTKYEKVGIQADDVLMLLL